ncbi:MAG: tetratricopeptide repeat protein, partial [Thermoguttaceae bacterium]|nr:tetratricopeptide repeat protein [Thermoguttaceae bacterium]
METNQPDPNFQASVPESRERLTLFGRRVLLVGRFAAATRKQTERLIRAAGGKIVDSVFSDVNLIVLGEGTLLGTDWLELSQRLNTATRRSFERGELKTITETELNRILGRPGIGEEPAEDRPLYTAAMLAELTGVPLASIRKWHRLGLLTSVRQVGRLLYFGAESVLAANRVKIFEAAGTKPEKLCRLIERFEQRHKNSEPVLPRLRLGPDGRTVLLPEDDNLCDARGQRFFELDLDERAEEDDPTALGRTDGEDAPPEFCFAEELFGLPRAGKLALGAEEIEAFEREIGRHVVALCEEARNLAEAGQFEKAIRCCRLALCGGGADVGISFMLAELFAQTGDWSAARERYYMVLELEEDHLEARAGLGRVLARQGAYDDAVELFRGALTIDPNYLDIHF